VSEAYAYAGGVLHAEAVPLTRLAAQFGTPCYVYSRAAIEAAYREYDRALEPVAHLVCYAAKANANLAVLDILARLGSGFDIVSGGELARVRAAGGDAARTVFSGVGKTDAEMAEALAAGILCFNVESESELRRLAAVAAAANRVAPVSVRVNPDVDARTHPYISTGLRENKFGVPLEMAGRLYATNAATPSLRAVGVDMHIGSQVTELAPFRDAAQKVLALVDRLAASGIALAHVDLGGGLGVRYRDEQPLALADYAAMVRELMDGRAQTLIVEPGRRLVASAGILLTRVIGLKRNGEHRFAIVDAAMNDLLRPALYDAWHAVDPVQPRAGTTERWDVVGPVCESADFLARGRDLALAEGDLLAVRTAGAYGMTMSSNYNGRPRAAEVVVDGTHAHLARRRESVEDLWRGESRLP
jgi:diaminopimelate decarboxylase